MNAVNKRLSYEHKKKISDANIGKRPSLETRRKISLALKGRKLPIEVRVKMGLARKGVNHPLYGKKLSDEVKRKISVSNKGHRHSYETIKKLSNALKGNKNCLGKKHSDLTKERISNKLKGHSVSHETRQRMRLARQHQVVPFKDTKPERMMQLALQLHGIKFRTHEPIAGQPDIFIEPNICIFIDGDFYHANPDKYESNDYIIHGRFARDIWARDIQITHELSKLGCYVIRIWEHDVINDKDDCTSKLITLIKDQKMVSVTKIRC